MDKKQKDSAEGELSFTLSTHNVLSSGHDNLFVTCMLTNARSIMNKLAELQNYIDQYRPLIIGITETWCTNSISDAELHLEDYNSFSCDRIDGRGGGLCILYILLPVIL